MKKLLFSLFTVITFLISVTGYAQTITRQQAIEDIEKFRDVLNRESSYLYSKGAHHEAAIDKVIAGLDETVVLKDLYYDLVKILGNIGDRHSGVYPENIKNDSLGMPFMMAPVDGNIVALKKELVKDTYQLFQKNYPYLKSINDMPIQEFIEKISWRHKHAPKYAKIHQATRERNYDYFLTAVFGKSDTYKFTFTNGSKDKSLTLPLTENPKRWRDLAYSPNIKDLPSLFKIVGNNIGYISLPAMVSKRDRKGGNLHRYVPAKMHDYKNTDALIIDLRYNGGGTRDFLMMLAPYFLSPDAKPWVANVTRIRSDQKISEDMRTMQARYLYNTRSRRFTRDDIEAIKAFSKDFKTEWAYNPERFSDAFYMVLSHDLGVDHYYYDKPVYVLVNERSFSAASVFTSALKGMGNVKIAGMGTDGSSGRSQYFELKHSKFDIRLSSMISFQRNGKTLDTNGTEPDIVIPKDVQQVLGNRDTQLENLVKHIEGK